MAARSYYQPTSDLSGQQVSHSQLLIPVLAVKISRNLQSTSSTSFALRLAIVKPRVSLQLPSVQHLHSWPLTLLS